MLFDTKLRVLNVAKRAQAEGLCKHKSGNFSERDAETGLVVITPAGVDREKLAVADMVVMDLDARVVESLSGLKPTSEALMHLRIYAERPDAVAIAHTHSMYATTFAVLARPIPAVAYEMTYLNCADGRVPVAAYARPGTVGLAENVAACVRDADAVLLESHGAVTVDGESIEGAYLKAAYLEELAELYHHALAANGGAEPPALPVSELESWEYPREITLG